VAFSFPASRHAELEVKDIQSHPLTVNFPSGSRLRLRLRSGDFRIVGHEDDKISVASMAGMPAMRKTSPFRFRRSGDEADMKISGGPKNGLQDTIAVPA
jgi:hypothetical protein